MKGHGEQPVARRRQVADKLDQRDLVKGNIDEFLQAHSHVRRAKVIPAPGAAPKHGRPAEPDR
jgi:hypothetical protein